MAKVATNEQLIRRAENIYWKLYALETPRKEPVSVAQKLAKQFAGIMKVLVVDRKAKIHSISSEWGFGNFGLTIFSEGIKGMLNSEFAKIGNLELERRFKAALQSRFLPSNPPWLKKPAMMKVRSRKVTVVRAKAPTGKRPPYLRVLK